MQRLVQRFLPDEMDMMKAYNGHLTGFYSPIKLINYIEFAEEEENSNNISPEENNLEHYRQLKVKLNMTTNVSELSVIYVNELWTSIAERHCLPSLTAILKRL